MKLLVTTIILFLAYLIAVDPTSAYTVKNGDTMTKIASENNLTLKKIAEVNPQIQNLNLIYVGDTVYTEEPKWTSYSDSQVDVLAKLIRSEVQPDELEEVKRQIQNLYSFASDKTLESEQTVSTLDRARYSDYEIDLLARLVRAEAQTEPFDGKIAVACVVLNRVENSNFPNTIREVIYETGQFQPVSNGEINEPADSESIAAVNAALTEQRHMVPESLFFYNPTIATSRWLDTRTTTLVIGQHVFKK